MPEEAAARERDECARRTAAGLLTLEATLFDRRLLLECEFVSDGGDKVTEDEKEDTEEERGATNKMKSKSNDESRAVSARSSVVCV